jgi:hypothetical protein
MFWGPISAWRVSGGCSRGAEVVIGRLGAAAAVVQSSEVQMPWECGGSGTLLFMPVPKGGFEARPRRFHVMRSSGNIIVMCIFSSTAISCTNCALRSLPQALPCPGSMLNGRRLPYVSVLIANSPWVNTGEFRAIRRHVISGGAIRNKFKDYASVNRLPAFTSVLW